MALAETSIPILKVGSSSALDVAKEIVRRHPEITTLHIRVHDPEGFSVRRLTRTDRQEHASEAFEHLPPKSRETLGREKFLAFTNADLQERCGSPSDNFVVALESLVDCADGIARHIPMVVVDRGTLDINGIVKEIERMSKDDRLICGNRPAFLTSAGRKGHGVGYIGDYLVEKYDDKNMFDLWSFFADFGLDINLNAGRFSAHRGKDHVSFIEITVEQEKESTAPVLIGILNQTDAVK